MIGFFFLATLEQGFFSDLCNAFLSLLERLIFIYLFNCFLPSYPATQESYFYGWWKRNSNPAQHSSNHLKCHMENHLCKTQYSHSIHVIVSHKKEYAANVGIGIWFGMTEKTKQAQKTTILKIKSQIWLAGTPHDKQAVAASELHCPLISSLVWPSCGSVC